MKVIDRRSEVNNPFTMRPNYVCMHFARIKSAIISFTVDIGVFFCFTEFNNALETANIAFCSLQLCTQ
jgi:hypothetical protein